jgi:hypothetical protein
VDAGSYEVGVLLLLLLLLLESLAGGVASLGPVLAKAGVVDAGRVLLRAGIIVATGSAVVMSSAVLSFATCVVIGAAVLSSGPSTYKYAAIPGVPNGLAPMPVPRYHGSEGITVATPLHTSQLSCSVAGRPGPRAT